VTTTYFVTFYIYSGTVYRSLTRICCHCFRWAVAALKHGNATRRLIEGGVHGRNQWGQRSVSKLIYINLSMKLI